MLFKALGAQLNRMKVRPGKHDAIEGMEQLDKVIAIDQSPIGQQVLTKKIVVVSLMRKFLNQII